MLPAVHDAVLTDKVASYRVVIVGAGFGGLFAAKFLKRPLEITLVDRTNHHLFQPLLYQVATGILPPGAVAALQNLEANAKVELGDVVDVDLVEKTVAVVRPDGRRAALPYDSLVAAAASGSLTSVTTSLPSSRRHEDLADALVQREQIFGAFEIAELEDDLNFRPAWLTSVVVGGGRPVSRSLDGSRAREAAWKDNSGAWIRPMLGWFCARVARRSSRL